MPLWHSTNWDLAQIQFPMRARTPLDASYYWRHRMGPWFTKEAPESAVAGLAEMVGQAQAEALVREMEAKARPMARAKELWFEEARATFYPHLPSRRRCIFLVEGDKADATETLASMGIGALGRALLEVELLEPSAALRVHPGHLNCNERPQDWEVRAHRYWSGATRWRGTELLSASEVLYEGEFVLLEPDLGGSVAP